MQQMQQQERMQQQQQQQQQIQQQQQQLHPSMLSHVGDAERGLVPYDYAMPNARHHGFG